MQGADRWMPLPSSNARALAKWKDSFEKGARGALPSSIRAPPTALCAGVKDSPITYFPPRTVTSVIRLIPRTISEENS